MLSEREREKAPLEQRWLAFLADAGRVYSDKERKGFLNSIGFAIIHPGVGAVTKRMESGPEGCKFLITIPLIFWELAPGGQRRVLYHEIGHCLHNEVPLRRQKPSPEEEKRWERNADQEANRRLQQYEALAVEEVDKEQAKKGQGA